MEPIFHPIDFVKEPGKSMLGSLQICFEADGCPWKMVILAFTSLVPVRLKYNKTGHQQLLVERWSYPQVYSNATICKCHWLSHSYTVHCCRRLWLHPMIPIQKFEPCTCLSLHLVKWSLKELYPFKGPILAGLSKLALRAFIQESVCLFASSQWHFRIWPYLISNQM